MILNKLKPYICVIFTSVYQTVSSVLGNSVPLKCSPGDGLRYSVWYDLEYGSVNTWAVAPSDVVHLMKI